MEKLKVSTRFDRSSDLVLYSGDCLDLLSEMPDEYAKLVVTSPPYNLGKAYESRLSLDQYLEQHNKVIAECVRVLHHHGSM